MKVQKKFIAFLLAFLTFLSVSASLITFAHQEKSSNIEFKAQDIQIQQDEFFDVSLNFQGIKYDKETHTILYIQSTPAFDVSVPQEYVSKYKLVENETKTETEFTRKITVIPKKKKAETDKEDKVTEETVAKDSKIPKETMNYVTTDLEIVSVSSRALGLEYLGPISYGGSTVGTFRVNGHFAFCIEHSKSSPQTGTSFDKQIYDNENIKKAMYYGYDGVERWNGFNNDSHAIVATSLIISHYYSGSPASILPGGILSGFYNYLQGKTLPSTTFTISKSYTESFLSENKQRQQTEQITLNADRRNYINFSLPSGVKIHNITKGTTNSGNVRVNGGDTFYFTAPLFMNGTWSSGDFVSPLGKYTAVVALTPSSSLQNLGYADWVTDPERKINLNIKWLQMGDIQLVKFLESPGDIKTPAVGVEFTLTHQETNEKVVIKVNESGIATTEDRASFPVGRLIGGTWRVEETKPYPGYSPVQPFNVTVVGIGQIFTYILEDHRISSPVSIEKVDKSTGQRITACSATFKIRNKNTQEDIEFTAYSPNQHSFIEFKTDESGQFTLPNALPYGDYELIEIAAPNGYLINEEPIDFSVTTYNDWGNSLVVTATNQNVKGKIEILKVEKDNSDMVLENAVFEIRAKEDIITPDGTIRVTAGELVDTITTDIEGKAISKELYLGKYEVQEVKAPEDYLILKEPFEVEIIYKDQNTPILIQTETIENDYTKTVINKIDSLTKEKLAGAKLQLLSEDKTVLCEWESNAEEGYKIDKLPVGKYFVREIEAPAEYELIEDVEFTVEENGEIKEVFVTNTRLAGVIQTSMPDNMLSGGNSKTGDNVLWLAFIGVIMLLSGSLAVFVIHNKHKTAEVKNEK